MEQSVAVLFARRDSVYKTMPQCDVYDIDRDARTYTGSLPVIAHPPCRLWGTMRRFSIADESEKDLALWAVDVVRSNGGVLEHPASSTLWAEKPLPRPGSVDEFGGWTLPIHQQAFGHRAQKPTFLYIVGCAPSDVPEFPLVLGRATHCIRPGKKYPRLPSVTKAEREHTPPALAAWLVDLAQRCRRLANAA